MADILIRGMEEPPHCSACRMLDGDAYDGFCHAANKWLEDEWFCWRQYPEGDIATDKPLNCPLIPLPEGHGDLIDRDAFRAENGLNAKCEHCPTNTYECQRDMIHTKMEFCGMLDDAPVIVPAEGGEADGN